ncbi:MAG: FkbM family methyltransferase [Selenomonadaceae bacterium]|nr:FkbM family methyltransferase [Selenomonadaceae bacterium]
MQRWFNFNTCRTLNDFVACTVEGLSYVATSKDITIMSEMYINRVNWAAGEMKIFYELSKQYYNVDDSKGYFLDLGANIGTTGIYFTKKLAPNLKLLSFEPDAENFKLHRINLILNDMESASTLVNFGLGDKFDEVIMYRDLVNPGHNNITEPKENVPTETIKIIPLDSYLYENNISAQEVKYIWIDTEGFEPQVLLGAKNLLRENPAPIFMECNLRAWDNSGYFEDMFMFLSENYSHFALIASGKGTLYSLETLRELERPDNTLGQIGDIFFVRRGAID